MNNSNIIKLLLLGLTLNANSMVGYSQNWLPVGEGLMCTQQALVFDITIDSLTGYIYARGDIAFDGNCDTMRTAVRWNGEQWERMGPSLGTLHGSAIGIYKNKVYASGNWWGIHPPYYQMDLLGCWNGDSWDSIPGSPTYISLIEEHNDDLYATGSFDSCADFQTKLITRYHNGEWEKLAPYFFDDTFYGLAMAIYKDTVYLGGKFEGAQELGPGINNAAKVYNTEFHAIGHGLNTGSIVEAMVVHNDTLFLGGSFSPGNFDTGQQSYLVTYANGKLEPYPVQPDGRVVALKTYRNALYVAGWFHNVGDSASAHVVKLKNGNIEVLNKDSLFLPNGTLTIGVRDIEIYNDTLYMAGGFYAIGQDTALNSIAKLNRALEGPLDILNPESIVPSFHIYPNPSDNLSIEIKLASHSLVQFEIYDVTGRLVTSWKETLAAGTHKKEYSYADLPSATYLVRVVTGAERIVTKRWVKVE